MFGMARLYRARRKRTIGRILISAHPPQGFPHPQSGLILRINERGLVKTDAQGATTHPGIFASGDVVRGAKTVVEAVHCSKTVADAMDRYMRSLPRS